MKAMALAAGKGTRLFPLTGEIPKPMAPVVNTPIIEHIFDLLAGHGIEEVHVNVHYLADTLLEAYGKESRVNGMSVYLEREDELLGTAGGVKRLADRFDDTFVVVSGDALTDVNITELVNYHKAARRPGHDRVALGLRHLGVRGGRRGRRGEHQGFPGEARP